MYELNICHLYPDILNLYGDRGNIIALEKRCSWRGIDVTISNISIGDIFDAEQHDIIFIGGGQDYEQEILQNDLLIEKGSEVKNAINSEKVFLTICGGFQLLGNYYTTWDKKEIELLGALNIWTIGSKERMIGNFVFECDFLMDENCDGKIVGFENHSGKTYLGDGVKPLGKIIKGFGNNGEDKTEGAIYKNVYCSYSHGSLLPKNPTLADHLISIALRQKYKDFVALQSLNDGFESKAHNSMIKRII
ncbi:UNVERIFIED_CONTAM: hypothetical protein Cloal_4194 [Acetivibrio alkalicellulosi]